jgi:hypothetical protein
METTEDFHSDQPFNPGSENFFEYGGSRSGKTKSSKDWSRETLMQMEANGDNPKDFPYDTGFSNQDLQNRIKKLRKGIVKEDPIKTELRTIKYLLVIIAFILSVMAISCKAKPVKQKTETLTAADWRKWEVVQKQLDSENVKIYKSITLENVLIDTTGLTREDSVGWFGQKGYDSILKFK